MDLIDIDSKKLSELQLVTQLDDTDFLIFEHPMDGGTILSEEPRFWKRFNILQENNGVLYLEDLDVGSQNRHSYKISYLNFKKQMSEVLYQDLNIGNVASCENWDFSRLAHGHDYSDVWFFPSYGPNSGNTGYKDILSCQYLGDFNVRKYLPGSGHADTSIKICIPKYKNVINDEAQTNNKYAIGQVCPIAVKNFQTYLTNYKKQTLKQYGGVVNVDIYSDEFDGFVIPNGATLTCNAGDFQKACEFFTGNPNATSFQVPSLYNFVRFNNNTDESLNQNEFKRVPYHTAIQTHGHGIQSSGGQVNLKINEPQLTQSTDGTIPLHYAEWQKHGCYAELSVTQVNLGITSISNAACTNSDSSLNLATYPSYVDLPCLIYIGGI